MRILAALLFSFFLFACSKSSTDNEVVDLGYNYFPNQVGSTWIYQVDSFVYDDNSGATTIDTFSYLYKVVIAGSYTDVTGKMSKYLNRFFKLNDTTDWVEANRWSLTQTELNAQKQEENIRFAKLVFPLALNKKWDGNMFNALGVQDYSVKTFDQPLTIGSVNYNQTMKVVERSELNAIEEIVKYEVYARDIGRVYLLSDSLNTQISGSRGYRYRLTLKSFTP